MTLTPPIDKCPLRQYFVWPKQEPTWRRAVIAASSGQAKVDYFRELRDAWQDAKYIDIRCESGAAVQSPPDFVRMAEYRGVPFARIGMRVCVGGRWGWIAGNNPSANFNVYFPASRLILNCHPNSEVRYFDDDGKELFPAKAEAEVA